MARQEIDDLQLEIKQCRSDFREEFRKLGIKRWNERFNEETVIKINNDFDILEEEHDIKIKALILILQDMIKKQTLREKEEVEALFIGTGIHDSSVIRHITCMAKVTPGHYRCPGINPNKDYGECIIEFNKEVNGMCYFCGKKARIWLCYVESPLKCVRSC